MTYQSNYSDQSQHEQTAQRTNQNSPIKPTLVRVFLCPCVDPIPILGLIPDGIIGYENFTVVLGPHSNFESLLLICYWRTTAYDYHLTVLIIFKPAKDIVNLFTLSGSLFVHVSLSLAHQQFIFLESGGESIPFVPVCPGLDFQTQRHMRAEYVGSLLCFDKFFPGYSGFPRGTPVFPRVLRFSPGYSSFAPGTPVLPWPQETYI